jgi:CubicO group peptidase (beta-lactamase class C family)
MRSAKLSTPGCSGAEGDDMTTETTAPPTETTALEAKVAELASEYEVPGVAVGILLQGDEQYAVHGVTSIESPVPIDENTLFQFGSTGKTFTASAIMRLVEQGKIDLDAPVRTYVPELRLKDEDVAQRVTVLQLLNHSAGWQGDFFEDTSSGDDAIALYVEKMSTLEQVYPLGTQGSYNNASLVLAGRVIEKVTGQTYAEAIKTLILDPLGLDMTFSSMNDIMTRRFVVGHVKHPDGNVTVARPWALPRSMYPAGGWSASVRDQLAWARFHLGDGRGTDGTQVLSKATLDRMKEETFNLGASAIGDAVGISWLLKDVEGVRLVGHGGTTHGQLSAFQMVPARGFAVVVLTNSAPNGAQFHGAIVKWALEHYLGVVQHQPEPLTLTPDELSAYTGTFRSISAILEVTAVDGALSATIKPTPESVARLRERGEEEREEQPPLKLDLLPDDRFVIGDGPAKGQRGYFTRDDAGDVNGINLGGRYAARQTEVATG